MLLFLYRFITYPLFLFMPFMVWRRIRQGKEIPGRWLERFGIASRLRPPNDVIWFHAASVGEANSIIPLIYKLHEARPELYFVITTITLTSSKVLEKYALPNTYHQFLPLDIPLYVGLFLRHWKPNLGILVESELWPNLLYSATKRHIPLILLNARLSDKSQGKWKKYPATIAKLLQAFSIIVPGTKIDQDKFKRLGAKHLCYIGNLKYATPPLPYDDEEFALLKKQVKKRKHWLCSSIHIGEIATCLEVHQQLSAKHKGLLTIIAPRHPENGPMIREAAQNLGLICAQRSKGEPIQNTTQIYIADTVGELGLFYHLNQIAFIGGSLIPHGGQNMIEPTRLGCIPLVGPYTSNFAEIVHKMIKNKVLICIMNTAQLGEQVDTLLREPAKLQELLDNAIVSSQHQDEILIKTTHMIIGYLDDTIDKAKNLEPAQPN